MRHELQVFDDAIALANAAATYVAGVAHDFDAQGAPFSLAVSGGKSPWLMLEELAQLDVAWLHTVVYQVDERVIADGDPERNLTNLEASLSAAPATIEAMDVTSDNLDEAARRYAEKLPRHLNLVHLGLGPDGHCASLVPDDPILDVEDRLVAVSGLYQGTRRLSLTYPALAAAEQVLWLVSGADKRDALAKLLAGERSIPAGRVAAPSSLILADRAALGE